MTTQGSSGPRPSGPLALRKALALLGLGVFLVAALFQNCGALKTSPQGIGSSSSTTPVSQNGLQLSISDSNGRIIAASDPLFVGASYVGRLNSSEGDVLSMTTANTLNGTEPCQLGVQGAVNPSLTVSCPEAGIATLTLLANVRVGMNILPRTYTLTKVFVVPGQPAPSSASASAYFRIPVGTQGSEWNSSQQPIDLFVGQVLRVINRDTVNHQVGTPMGRPCAASPVLPPGGVYDCVVTSGYAASQGSIYDPLFSTSARFYLRAFDGRQIYTSLCHNAHGPIASSDVRGVTAADIMAAVRNVRGMNGLQNQLMQQDYTALEWALR